MTKYENTMMLKMEHKLRELMSEEDFNSFIKEIAKEAFRSEINDLTDDDFKQYVRDNFDKITGNT